MKRTLLAMVGIACASILLVGCQLNVITEIEPSGAGTLTTEIGMTPDEVDQLGSLQLEPGDGLCSSLSAGETGTADGPAFEEETRGEDTWCVAVTRFEDLEDLAALYEEMGFVRIRELTLREGVLAYDVEIDAQASGEELRMPVETTWVLKLPGRIGGHNADSAEGRQLMWTVGAGSVVDVQASSDLLVPSLPVDLGGWEAWIIGAIACACCGGIFLLVVVLTVVLLRRKRPAPAPRGNRGQES